MTHVTIDFQPVMRWARDAMRCDGVYRILSFEFHELLQHILTTVADHCTFAVCVLRFTQHFKLVSSASLINGEHRMDNVQPHSRHHDCFDDNAVERVSMLEREILRLNSEALAEI